MRKAQAVTLISFVLLPLLSPRASATELDRPPRRGDNALLLVQGPSSQQGPSVKVLSRDRLGDRIEDGAGFGGIRIDSPETELLTRWGATIVTKLSTHAIYDYLLDSGEAVALQLRNGTVKTILFMGTPNLSVPSVRTRKGIGLGASLEEVKAAYGNPDRQRGPEVSYLSQGIGFHVRRGRVAAIVVFQPGRPPE